MCFTSFFMLKTSLLPFMMRSLNRHYRNVKGFLFAEIFLSFLVELGGHV